MAYLVHDLSDAAVRRRVIMLQAAGAHVELGGFFRRSYPDLPAPAMPLGRTADGRLSRRFLSVAKHLFQTRTVVELCWGADVVIARNLEMLVLAARAARAVRPRPRLIYECLDIHRMMLGATPISVALRWLERRLLQRANLLLISSPAFLHEYFERRQGFESAWRLVENKVLDLGLGSAPPSPQSPGPPWRIGWFGMLRCRRSLQILTELVRSSAGSVEVVMRGKPSPDQLPDLDAVVAATPGLHFDGPYRAEDLPALYGSVHFAWAIDFFEDRLNSSWLLPNRLYESAAFGAVPIALADVETGRWLADHQAGLRLERAEDLADMLTSLTALDYQAMAAAVRQIAREDLVDDQASASRLAEALGS